MIKIALGTNSGYKINAVTKVLAELDVEFELFPFEVDSGVSEQPGKTNETKQGAINRAKGAIDLSEDSNIGLGVEFGYEPFEDGYKMICYASIATNKGEILWEHSSSLQLPIELQKALEDDVQVYSKLDETLDKLEETQVTRSALYFIKKRRVIYESVENVMLRYLLNDVWY